MNTWAWPLADRPDTRRLSRLIATAVGRFLYVRLNASPRWILPLSFVDRSRLPAEVHAQYLTPFAERSRREATWRLGVALVGSDPYYASLEKRLTQLRSLPVHLLWGVRDPAFGAKELERWQSILEPRVTATLPNVGHFPQEERPGVVIAALRRIVDVADIADGEQTP
jgi:haloalkane dehalogenase